MSKTGKSTALSTWGTGSVKDCFRHRLCREFVSDGRGQSLQWADALCSPSHDAVDNGVLVSSFEFLASHPAWLLGYGLSCSLARVTDGDQVRDWLLRSFVRPLSKSLDNGARCIRALDIALGENSDFDNVRPHPLAGVTLHGFVVGTARQFHADQSHHRILSLSADGRHVHAAEDCQLHSQVRLGCPAWWTDAAGGAAAG